MSSSKQANANSGKDSLTVISQLFINAKSISQLRYLWAAKAVKLSKAERGNLSYFYNLRKNEISRGKPT